MSLFDRESLPAALVFGAAVAFAVSPLLSAGFDGFAAGQFPIPQDDPPIQPAGYAFSIWGVIYLWLIAHGAFGLLRRDDDIDWAPMRWPAIVSLAVGVPWLAVASLSPAWATLQIWVMLIAAIVAMARAPMADRWLARAPMGFYAGWLTAASFVSLGLTGAGYGVAFGGVGWAWLGLIAAIVFAGIVQVTVARTPFYGAAVAWGLVGITVHNWGTSYGVAVLALLGAFVIVALALRPVDVLRFRNA